MVMVKISLQSSSLRNTVFYMKMAYSDIMYILYVKSFVFMVL